MPRLQIISALYPAVIVLHGRRASSDVGAEGFGPRCSGSVRSFAAPLPAKALASKTCLVSGWPQTPSCDDQASEGIFWRHMMPDEAQGLICSAFQCRLRTKELSRTGRNVLDKHVFAHSDALMAEPEKPLWQNDQGSADGNL